MKRVFISTSSFGEFSEKPLSLLKEKGYEVTLNPHRKKLNKAQCLDLYPHYDGIIAGTETFDAEVLDQATNLKIISRVGVGLDSIDLEYARLKNITVIASKTSPALSVAELTIGLIIDLLRSVSEQNRDLKSGIWEKKMGRLLSGKILGIIGLGSIGKKVIELTQGFSLHYLAYDIYHNEEFAAQNQIDYVELDELLNRSDIVSIHLNLNERTKNLITLTEMKKMKPESLIINTSRGGIVNEEDLLQALKDDIIGGTALDVFDQEPYSGPLITATNVLLTPHVGSYAREIRLAMETEAAENIISTLK